MTDREAMKQALGALENAETDGNCEYGATDLLRAAIEQAERQEPVAWITKWSRKGSRGTVLGYKKERCHDGDVEYIPLYTTPPAAQPAPDLLNALKRIVDEPNNTMSDGKALKEIIRIARTAIAKTTGKQA
jgi:hypothetical protein